jgi:hypothetical protein
VLSAIEGTFLVLSRGGFAASRLLFFFCSFGSPVMLLYILDFLCESAGNCVNKMFFILIRSCALCSDAFESRNGTSVLE